MSRSTVIAVLLVFAAALSSSCDNAGADRVLSIDATGTVLGFVYFDANANREHEDSDADLAGVRVSLVSQGGVERIASARSDDQGLLELSSVPVGDYEVVVDTASIGDSTVVADIDFPWVTVVPNDTQDIIVAISFPISNTSEVLALPIGSKTFVDGIALTAGAVFGDSTLHIADSSGALRVIRVGTGPVSLGDSVRLRGTVASRDGQPVLDMNRQVPQVLAIAEAPAPDSVGTAEAATALSGVLDAGIVRIGSARVIDTATVGGDFVVTADDGSGELDILLDGDIAFNPGPYLVPGVDVSVSGILVSTGGAWSLKPRSDADIDVSPPVLTVSAVRGVPAGQVVFVEGKVLTPMSVAAQATVFGDSTLHIADASGAIRITRVPPANLALGDSVRFVGTTAVRDGQLVVDQPTLFLLGSAFAGQPQTVSTSEAADASSGALDAAFVRIDSARVLDTTTVGGDFVLTVNDGTGELDVVFDNDITFNPGPYFLPGADIEADGLLVPSGGGSWQLKPRDDADVEMTAPVLAVSQARSAQIGAVVFIDGKVLTPMSAASQASVFGDSIVHVSDTSGAIRVRTVQPLDLAVGDSVRFVGTLAASDGQPLLREATAFGLGSSFAPLPRTVTTSEASSASSGSVGSLDAALVRVDSARISDTTTIAGELVITASDGSGSLEIRIDDDITFTPGQYLLPGADIAVDGVLVPSGSDWQIKPRGDGDVTISVPVISVAAARATAVGEVVFVDGTALNYVVPSVAGAPPRTAFQDTTVHVSDPTGAIRGKSIVVPGADVTAGDTIRLYGQTALVDDQPVIDATHVFRLDDRPELQRTAALPLTTTALAATANGGAADAAFVSISNVTIASTATVGADFHVTVNDGSGAVVVVLDGDVAFDLAPLIPGEALDVWGLMVAEGGGSWVLKPREPDDVQP